LRDAERLCHPTNHALVIEAPLLNEKREVISIARRFEQRQLLDKEVFGPLANGWR
jgi:hypothetical protein